jgi:hypothetical protein
MLKYVVKDKTCLKDLTVFYVAIQTGVVALLPDRGIVVKLGGLPYFAISNLIGESSHFFIHRVRATRLVRLLGQRIFSVETEFRWSGAAVKAD